MILHYIDKDAVVAEIESLLDNGRYLEEYDCAYRDGNNGALCALKNKIDTLEAKEVDLKEEQVTSVWHDKDEEPDEDTQVLINLYGYCYVVFYHKEDKRFYMFGKPKHYLCEINGWAYIQDILKSYKGE